MACCVQLFPLGLHLLYLVPAKKKGRVDVIAITMVMSYLVPPSFQEALKHHGGMLRLCKIITQGIQQNVSV